MQFARMYRTSILVSLAFCLFTWTSPVSAQVVADDDDNADVPYIETRHGDSCTTVQNGWVRTSGGPGIMPVTTRCNGSVWVTVAASGGGAATSEGCITPWNTVANHGASVTAYQSYEVFTPATCVSQTRSCANGTLSGTYANRNCVVKTDACASSPSPGATCADGSIYVGLSPDGNVPMYATRCDAGMSWNGSACTGTRSAYIFGMYGTVTNYYNANTGRSNTTNLASKFSDTFAAKYCENLVEGGKSDWYLPAINELNVLAVNRTAIPGLNWYYWSSSEHYNYDTTKAYIQSLTDGTQTYDDKNKSLNVRCVRR